MKKLIIRISGEWVLERWEDEVSPTQYVQDFMGEKYAGLKFLDSGFTEVEYEIVGNDFDFSECENQLKEAFNARYSLVETGDILTVSVEEEAGELPVDIDENLEGEKKTSETKSEESKTEEVAEIKKEETEQQEESEKKSLVDECMKTIDGLIGGEEFKDFATEVVQIAPQIIQNKTYDTFAYQAYLFSINEGYGLSTYLREFARLLSALKIRQTSDSVKELKLPAPGEGRDAFSEVRTELRMGSKVSQKIICIDISEWMNSINDRQFKSFLMDVERYMSESVIVFRIPFVGKEVLDSVKYAIEDLMFVRTVSFPPFTRDEIRRCAKAELARYGFKMSVAAWNGFDAKIAEEKRDGKFYGVNTIRKVVRELLYKKQLSNAKRGKTDLCISKKDTESLCSTSDDFGLSGKEMLNRLVGADGLKNKILEIVSQIEFAYNNPEMNKPCIHMRFVGNPGTGKTTVARIVGKLLREKGVLRIGNFFEYAGRDFCGRYIGETAPKTASMCRDAYGSILFIDEAYSLFRDEDNPRDYGREALDTLIAEMENHRSDLVVIMAGYTDEMDTLMKGNAGLASRMPYVIEFPNFSREQLYNVFVSMLGKNTKYDGEMLVSAKAYFDSLPDALLNSKEFSNARFVRNLFERTWAKAAMRCQLEKKKEINLTKDDFDRSANDKEFKIVMEKKTRIGFVE